MGKTHGQYRHGRALLQRCWRVGILREFGAKGFRFSCWERIMPFKLHSKGRRHIPRQRHRVTNWREYDASLRNRGSLTVWLCDQRRLACSAGDSPAGARIRSPVVWIAGWRETKTLKPIDKISLGEITSHRAVTKVNAEVA